MVWIILTGRDCSQFRDLVQISIRKGIIYAVKDRDYGSGTGFTDAFTDSLQLYGDGLILWTVLRTVCSFAATNAAISLR